MEHDTSQEAELWEVRLCEAAALQSAGKLEVAESLYSELAVQAVAPGHAELCLYHVAVLQEQLGDFAAADRTYGECETRLLEMQTAGTAPDQLLLRVCADFCWCHCQ